MCSQAVEFHACNSRSSVVRAGGFVLHPLCNMSLMTQKIYLMSRRFDRIANLMAILGPQVSRTFLCTTLALCRAIPSRPPCGRT